jgi:AP-4 complex subunit mu-1
MERLTVLFNANGYVVNSSIDDSILMKSFLSGNPELHLALNEDLVIGKGSGSYGSVILDDCIFQECVHLDEFESSRTLHFLPPDGEFAVLSYRITTDFRVPFKLSPTIEESGAYRLEVNIIIRCDIPDRNYGSNVIIRLPVPRCTVNCVTEFQTEIPAAHAEYNASEKKAIWTIHKFVGGSELNLKAKITVDRTINSMII